MSSIPLEELNIYKISIWLSDKSWRIYNSLEKTTRFHIGDQLVRSIDSIGANIAEGYGRFHYADSVKFYYNARGSLFESKHWIKLMCDRELIAEELSKEMLVTLDSLGVKLNNFIMSIYKKKTATINK